jgi:hypothetical protein
MSKTQMPLKRARMHTKMEPTKMTAARRARRKRGSSSGESEDEYGVEGSGEGASTLITLINESNM